MAIFTPISTDEAVRFLENYAVGTLLELIPIHGGIENTNYKLITSKATYVLTVFETRTPKEALPFVFKLLNHLDKQNLPVAKPEPNLDGDIISTLKGKPAAIVSFLEGSSVSKPSAEHCFAMGRCLAQLHLAGEDFKDKRQNPFDLSKFDGFFKNISADLNEIEQGLGSLIKNEIAFLNQHKLNDLPQGIIHADMFPDNVLFADNNKISGLIDFYYAATDIFAYDLAITLNCWASTADGGLDKERSAALLEGYTGERPLVAAEKQAMNTMFRMAALRFLLSRANDWFLPTETLEVAKKDPLEYVRKLKFHQKQQTYEGFGF